MKKFLAVFIAVSMVLASLTGVFTLVPSAKAAFGGQNVTFDTQGGSPTPAPITGIDVGATITLPEAPTKDGFAFASWNTLADGTGTIFDATTPVIANITVYASYILIPEMPTFTVTFDCQGGSSISPESISFGGFAYLPEAPTKAGFSFDSWNTSPDGTGTSFDATTQVFADITFYASYTSTPVIPATFTITFDTQGGSEITPIIDLTSGATVELPTAPTKAGFTFTSWNTAIDGTGTTFAATTPVIADITVYATYTAVAQPIFYTVTFDSNSGTPTPAPIIDLTSGATVELPPAPTKTGFTFEGWATKADGTGTIFDATTPVTADITVFASFTPVEVVPVIGGRRPATVVLGTAGNFVILAKAGISTTGATHVIGDIGISPASERDTAGFGLVADATNTFATSLFVTGKVYAADYADPTPATLTTAVSNMEAAYIDAATRPPATGASLNIGGGIVAGQTLAPGLYTWGSNVTITTDLTLSGGANDVWIFQIAGTLDLATNRKVLLTGDAQAKNIFWQVADVVTLHAGSHFEGNILASTNIALQAGASINGRLLAQSAVTLLANNISLPTVPEPVIPEPVVEPVIPEPIVEPVIPEPIIPEPKLIIPTPVIPTPVPEITTVYYQTFFNGYPDGTFKPDQNISRAEVAAAITRALGLGGAKLAPAYPDVPATHWAASAIQLMKEEGIMIGDTGGTFRPNAPITRAETATALLRLLKVAPIQNLPFSAFTDVSLTYWAAGYIAAMQAKGYITGYPDGTFKPTSNILRSETTAILDRVLGREISSVSQITSLKASVRFSDVPATHWAYLYILEASTPYTLTNAPRLARNLTLTGKTIPLYATEPAAVLLHQVGEVLTAIVPTDGLLKGVGPVARQVVVVITKKLKP